MGLSSQLKKIRAAAEAEQHNKKKRKNKGT
jgi:hypothetical protein